MSKQVGQAIGIGSTATDVWDIAKWPVLVAVLILMIGILYHAAPNVKLPGFRWITVGSSFALVIWVLASALFAFYVANFGSYDKTYGTLGGLISLLVWFWISNLALLFGMQLNAERERSRELAAGVPRADKEIQLEPREEPKRQAHDLRGPRLPASGVVMFAGRIALDSGGMERRTQLKMRLATLAAAAAALVLPVSQASAKDYAATALNVMPSGQLQPGQPPAIEPNDAQATLYDGLTPLFDQVTDDDLTTYFKSEALGSLGTDGPGTPEVIPGHPEIQITRDATASRTSCPRRTRGASSPPAGSPPRIAACCSSRPATTGAPPRWTCPAWRRSV